MSAKNIKPPTFVDTPTRCTVCGTTLTRYPMDYAPCPKCGKAVCRQCWREAWYSRDFSGEKCNHVERSQGPAVSPVAQKIRGPGIDWPKTVITTLLAIGAVGVLIFLWDLLAF